MTSKEIEATAKRVLAQTPLSLKRIWRILAEGPLRVGCCCTQCLASCWLCPRAGARPDVELAGCIKCGLQHGARLEEAGCGPARRRLYSAFGNQIPTINRKLL